MPANSHFVCPPIIPATADPTASEQWNVGCDFAMVHLCKYLGVDPSSVSWDAATETVDGDVLAVIGNILRAKFGEDWGPESTGAVAQGVPDPEEVSYDRANSVPVAWIAFAGNGNIRVWTSDEGRAKQEKERGLDLRAFTLAELVALAAKTPAQSSWQPTDDGYPDCATDRERELYDALVGLSSAVMARRREWGNWVQGGIKIAPIVRKALRLDGPSVASTHGECGLCGGPLPCLTHSQFPSANGGGAT